MSVTFVDLFKIIISAAFIENILLARYIGLCPYIGMSTNISNSLGMGMAVAFVMVLSSIVTWSLWNYIFIPLKLEYLRIMVFILVIAVLVQLVEILLKKPSQSISGHGDLSSFNNHQLCDISGYFFWS